MRWSEMEMKQDREGSLAERPGRASSRSLQGRRGRGSGPAPGMGATTGSRGQGTAVVTLRVLLEEGAAGGVVMQVVQWRPAGRAAVQDPSLSSASQRLSVQDPPAGW